MSQCFLNNGYSQSPNHESSPMQVEEPHPFEAEIVLEPALFAMEIEDPQCHKTQRQDEPEFFAMETQESRTMSVIEAQGLEKEKVTMVENIICDLNKERRNLDTP
ncbi:hypothetical protein GOP47_0012219 [Adiantum capillus-veneris]|uniref:Uncharacterized protein n=1 Tax=Adiantum capillus-veneris TaxID=13818 RepID=A0A9D4ZE40_ADICA|nr:hypothetical protein GOP47_0012219 [Adiantum capillus-veneris]